MESKLELIIGLLLGGAFLLYWVGVLIYILSVTIK
jgi:hypothetical protein